MKQTVQNIKTLKEREVEMERKELEKVLNSS